MKPARYGIERWISTVDNWQPTVLGYDTIEKAHSYHELTEKHGDILKIDHLE